MQIGEVNQQKNKINKNWKNKEINKSINKLINKREHITTDSHSTFISKLLSMAKLLMI